MQIDTIKIIPARCVGDNPFFTLTLAKKSTIVNITFLHSCQMLFLYIFLNVLINLLALAKGYFFDSFVKM